MTERHYTPKLFQPAQVGDMQLSHRVYYEQRSTTPGSLLITEATLIAQKTGGAKNTPGVWSDAQISTWKALSFPSLISLSQVSERVHANGFFIYLQIWALGRAIQADVLEKENMECVSASDIPLPGGPKPRPLTVDKVHEYMEMYAQGAVNAVEKAEFDGVEIHGANGYLIDQFLHPGSNFRTDEYGGSTENRVRFAPEVTEAVVKAVGQKKTGFRISPWGTWQEMYFDDPLLTYDLVTELRDHYPDLAYLHVVEPRADGDGTALGQKEHHLNDVLREIWGNKPLISAGVQRNTRIYQEHDDGVVRVSP
ncbi:hypothetical protein K438DRAFT_1914810 [Mycena galopus ATCC 62051]|nr:hypothetical protein K438DRAFT_1914810 [Mycena galopus ATCC 62051]